MPAEDTREMHLLWCRTRALAYLPDLARATGSMSSDLSKHPETQPTAAQLQEGLTLALNDDAAGVRDWIEDFR